MRRIGLAYGVVTLATHVITGYGVALIAFVFYIQQRAFPEFLAILAWFGGAALVLDMCTALSAGILILMRWLGRDISQYIGEKL